MSEAGSEEPKFQAPHSDSDTMPEEWREREPSSKVIQIGEKHKTLHGSPAQSPVTPGPITFNQTELRLIFGLYGRKVAAGEWRDYALDFLRDQAIFSIFRRSSEVPLYRIEKNPRLARKQGEYAAVAASGLILKRGSYLARVLAALDKPLKIVR